MGLTTRTQFDLRSALIGWEIQVLKDKSESDLGRAFKHRDQSVSDASLLGALLAAQRASLLFSSLSISTSADDHHYLAGDAPAAAAALLAALRAPSNFVHLYIGPV